MRREKKKIYGSTTRASFHVIYETKGGITIPGRSPCSLQPPRWVGDSRSFRSTASHTFTRLSTHAPRRSWACFICKQQAVLVCTFLHLFFLLPFLFFLSLYIYIYKEERISGTDEFLDRRLNISFYFSLEEKTRNLKFF